MATREEAQIDLPRSGFGPISGGRDLFGAERVAFENYFPESSAVSRLKRWNGSTWVVATLKRWDGSAWVPEPLRYWDGSSWVTA